MGKKAVPQGKALSTTELVAELRKGSVRALSRLISAAENQDPSALAALAELPFSGSRARIVGITGPPGAGKSSLVAHFLRLARSAGARAAVVAVDPVSPFTGGALLGDRIRLAEHFTDEGVFIRSLSTRGRLGGLTAATRQVVHLLEAFGFDWILLETVGVGQSEVDVKAIADVTLVALVPEAGDSVQAIKSGLMEIADLFVVNKADREGADRLSQDLRVALEIAGKGDVPVLKASTKDAASTEVVWRAIGAALASREPTLAARRKSSALATVAETLESLAVREARRWVERHAPKGDNPYRALADFLKRHPPERWFPA